MAKGTVFFDDFKTPPLESETRFEFGKALREFQDGRVPGEPAAKPVHQIGRKCYEIRKKTAQHNWRVYLAVRSHIVVLLLEDKKSDAIPRQTLDSCKSRLRYYEQSEAERVKKSNERRRL